MLIGGARDADAGLADRQPRSAYRRLRAGPQHLLQNLGLAGDGRGSRHRLPAHARLGPRGFGESISMPQSSLRPTWNHIIENRRIVRALWRAEGRRGGHLRTSTQVRNFDATEVGVRLALVDGSTLLRGTAGRRGRAKSRVRGMAELRRATKTLRSTRSGCDGAPNW